MRIRFALLLFLGLQWAGLGPAAAVAGQSLPVFVSILPQKYFVEKIGGDLVTVSVMVRPGANPHVYEPRPNQMAALSKARLYMAIGVTFEDVWLPRLAKLNPRMRTVHSDKGIDKMAMVSHHHADEETVHPPRDPRLKDAHRGEAQGSLDPHVWVSPPEVKIISRNILEALVDIDPANSGTYQSNYEAFIEEIEELDRDLKKIFLDKRGLKFMVFHPAWGYFARAYGLEQIPVELEGKEPKPEHLKTLIEQSRREGIKIIFVQPQFSTKSAETIAKAIDGQVIFADPLAEDWEQNVREQAEKFKKALQGQAK